MSTPEAISAEVISLLGLVQWLSPAFPTGAYAYSHGLEQAVVAGEVRSEAALADWLSDILAHGAGWNDAVLIAAALAGGDLAALSVTARALAGSAERLSETMDQGTAFARARSGMTGAEVAAHPLPIAFAEAARSSGLPGEQVIALYLHAFASNLVSAGVRFVPLGQDAGQRVLAGLHAPVAQIAARAVEICAVEPFEDALASSAFRADLGAMAHETLDVRIFRT